MKEKLNEILDRLAMCIVTGVAIFSGLAVLSAFSYLLISIFGAYIFSGICIFGWAFMRVMPNDYYGYPY